MKDKPSAVGEIIADSELMCIALKGFTKDWDVYVKCVVVWENFSSWKRLWDDFTQEEIQERSQEKTKHGTNEQDVALLAKGKKKKGSCSGASS